jgi:thiol-disulfide isomerase/thioredoxin
MKDIGIILFMIFQIALFENCANKNQKATLSADIENLGNDTVLIAIAPYDESITDRFVTIIAKEGKFKFDTIIDKLYYGRIISNKMFNILSNGEKFLIRSKPIDFFIQPSEKIELKGDISETRTNYQVRGNSLNKEFLKYRETIIGDIEESSILMFQVENHYLSNSPDTLISELCIREGKAYNAYLEKSLTFIQGNSDSEISAFLLLKENKVDIVNLFPNLSEKVKESVYGKLIQEKMNIWIQTKKGSNAPDFEYRTFNNQIIKLSDYKGKYVILDFWGSWCGPCISEMPKLKEFYDENREYFEIIGVACRDTKDQWEKAIIESELNWTQILNDKEGQDLNNIYGITVFPTKVIIDPNGIIEGYYLGATDDFFIKMKELIREK